MSKSNFAVTAERLSDHSLLRRAASRVGACPLILMAALFTASCGQNGNGIQVAVSPGSANVISQHTQAFTATVTGTSQTGVNWLASAGSITTGGVYTAPAVGTKTYVTVTATSNADPSQQASAAVVVEPANGQPLAITTGTLPNGQMGTAYNTVITATGGTQPYNWSASGNVPPGITLNPSTGDLAGMPGATGTFSFTVTVTDASGQAAQKGFTLVVSGQAPGGAPLAYSVARTDTNITQPDVTSNWGGATGINHSWCNPDYNNICIYRASDRTTLPNGPSFATAESESQAIWSVDSQYLILSAGKTIIVAMTMQNGHPVFVPTSTILASGKLVFSGSTINVAYSRNGTVVSRMVTTDGWQTSSQTTVVDFLTCLPPGVTSTTWQGTWAVPRGDQMFVSAFSDRGAQGSAEYVSTYSTVTGCSTLNTLTGTVTNNGVAIGTIDDGVNPLADRFTLHGAKGTLNPLYATLEIAPTDPYDGTSGCKTGNCQGPYIWQIGTTHLRPVGKLAGSHTADGYTYSAGSKVLRLHEYSNTSQPGTNLFTDGLFPSGWDFYASWLNTDGSDVQPPIMTIVPYQNQRVASHDKPYQDELLAVKGDGSGTVWRPGQHGASGISTYYVCHNVHAVVAPNGNWVAFTSDMGAGGSLGTDNNGNSACDIFVMELK